MYSKISIMLRLISLQLSLGKMEKELIYFIINNYSLSAIRNRIRPGGAGTNRPSYMAVGLEVIKIFIVMLATCWSLESRLT